MGHAKVKQKQQQISKQPTENQKPKSKSKLMKYGFGLGVVAACWGGLAARYSAPEGFYDAKLGTISTVTTIDSLDVLQFADEMAVLDQQGAAKKQRLIFDANKTSLGINAALSFAKEHPNYIRNGYIPLYTYLKNPDKNADETSQYSFYKTNMNISALQELENYTDSVHKSKSLLIPVDCAIMPIMRKSNKWLDDIVYAEIDIVPKKVHADLSIYAGMLRHMTMREIKFCIAHEMSHQIDIEAGFKTNTYNRNPTSWQAINNEKRADRLALDVTKDPDAAISTFGKFNLTKEKTTTLVGWFIEDVRNLFTSSSHPLSVDRARDAQKWKEQHLKR